MTEVRPHTENPARALEAAFRDIHLARMRDLPFVNAALSVEAVGFAPWKGRWLGVLVTPWFMNLVMLPKEAGAWRSRPVGEAQAYPFAAGVFQFIAAREEAIGEYEFCSLFSPMFEFGEQETARATAVAALEALFATDAEDGETGPLPDQAGDRLQQRLERPMSKREFLRFAPGDHDGGG